MRNLSTAGLNVYHGKEQSKPPLWSAEATKRSNALDLEPGVFTWKDSKKIAESLKRSAEESMRRKGTPLQSAMSISTFTSTALKSTSRSIPLREIPKPQSY